VDFVGRSDIRRSEHVGARSERGRVAARGNVTVAGSFESSLLPGFGNDKTAGASYRSTNGGASFTPISGAAGTGLPNGPVSSLVGDLNNPNRLYAAVNSGLPQGRSLPNAACEIEAARGGGCL